MGSPGDDSDGAAKSAVPFGGSVSQEEFDREFFGEILKRSDSNIDVVKRQAGLLARNGDHEGALHLDRLLTQREPNDPILRYNLACSLSMSGDSTSAITALARAIELGYHDFAQILSDPDLDPLRDLPDFNKLVRRRVPDDEPPRIV